MTSVVGTGGFGLSPKQSRLLNVKRTFWIVEALHMGSEISSRVYHIIFIHTLKPWKFREGPCLLPCPAWGVESCGVLRRLGRPSRRPSEPTDDLSSIQVDVIQVDVAQRSRQCSGFSFLRSTCFIHVFVPPSWSSHVGGFNPIRFARPFSRLTSVAGDRPLPGVAWTSSV